MRLSIIVPRGRRKTTSLSILTIVMLCMFATSASAVSAVLGIDFGTEYFKAAIARPGSPIEIVLTKDSKRKEAAALAFKPSRSQNSDPDAFPERLYGGDALALSARFPYDVYINLKSILGLSSLSRPVNDYLYRFPDLTAEQISRSPGEFSETTVGFKSRSIKTDGVFMIEELLAMQFQNIKANAKALVGKGMDVSDVVITVPAFYTAEEKRAVELAADLAGLRVLGLISDGLAVGLNYATQRTFENINEGGKPEYNIVYDMGAGSTTATVLKFQSRTVKGAGKRNTTFQEVHVLGFGADKTLGGDSLNDLIVADMVKKFLESPRMKPLGVASLSVRQHGKTMARLWKDAEKVRQVLSANTVASTTLEGLYYEDVTFKYSLTRDEFEILAHDHAGRVAGPLNDALLMANLRLDDIQSVILHGGLVRTPFIQKQLDDVAKDPKKLKTNVNADEAAVMGAAFRAASVSPAYRVKDIRGSDVSGAAYTVSWTQEDKQKEQKLFVPTSQTGIEKQVKVKTQEDSSIEFKLDSVSGPSEILSVELTNLTKSVTELKDKYGCAPVNITTLFNARLSPIDGIPELVSVSVSCKPVKDKEGGMIDSVKGMFGFGKKDQEPLRDQEGTKADEDPALPTPAPVEDPTSSGTTVSSATVTDEILSNSTSSTASAKAKPIPTIVVIPIAKQDHFRGLNQPPSKEMSTIQKRLAKFDLSDQNTILRAEALNVLEAYTYRARDFLEDSIFIEMSTDAVRKQLEQSLSSVSEWLYGDGVDAKLEDLKAKLKNLQAIVDPVLRRKAESSKREAAIDTFKGGLSSVESMIETIKTSIEKAAEDASSKASSVASSASEKVSSVIPSSEDDGELDNDPYTASSTVRATESDAPLPKMYEYTEEDLSSITKAFEAAKSWFDEKSTAQKKLSQYEDPVLLVADLETRAGQLQKTVTNMIMKQLKFVTPPRAKKSKTTKKDKNKTKKSKTSASASNSASDAKTATASTVKDEL